jgi:hypothetical protein
MVVGIRGGGHPVKSVPWSRNVRKSRAVEYSAP